MLQTILGFTLLGCSENRDVCGNGNGEEITEMKRFKRGGEGCYIYSINFYNP
jgi:hypothetical protein